MKEGTDHIPHGIGIQVGSSGYIYEGYWRDGKLHGRGRTIYPDTPSYVGEFIEGKKNGQGIEYYYNGNKKYEGEWKKSSYRGQGTYYTEDGDKYTGQWIYDEGNGEINYMDGTKYTGEWDYIDDCRCLKRHGVGTLYSAEGQVLNQGKWDKGVYVGNE